MRHRVAGRKLGRTGEHRLALMRNLSTELLDKERIKTTLAKAKELRGFTEKLVTLSKKETLHSRRLVLRHIHNREVVAKLFDTLSARYAQRPGGYTRVIKLGPRRGDNAEMAIIELVGSESAGDSSPKAKKSKATSKGSDASKKASTSSEKTATRKAAPKKRAGGKKGADSSSKKGAARSTTTRRSGGS